MSPSFCIAAAPVFTAGFEESPELLADWPQATVPAYPCASSRRVLSSMLDPSRSTECIRSTGTVPLCQQKGSRGAPICSILSDPRLPLLLVLYTLVPKKSYLIGSLEIASRARKHVKVLAFKVFRVRMEPELSRVMSLVRPCTIVPWAVPETVFTLEVVHLKKVPLGIASTGVRDHHSPLPPKPQPYALSIQDSFGGPSSRRPAVAYSQRTRILVLLMPGFV